MFGNIHFGNWLEKRCNFLSRPDDELGIWSHGQGSHWQIDEIKLCMRHTLNVYTHIILLECEYICFRTLVNEISKVLALLLILVSIAMLGGWHGTNLYANYSWPLVNIAMHEKTPNRSFICRKYTGSVNAVE